MAVEVGCSCGCIIEQPGKASSPRPICYLLAIGILYRWSGFKYNPNGKISLLNSTNHTLSLKKIKINTNFSQGINMVATATYFNNIEFEAVQNTAIS